VFGGMILINRNSVWRYDLD